MTSQKVPAFTVRAVRMTVPGSRLAAEGRSDVQPLARAAAETFAAAAEIARSFAITYGYPEELLLSQLEWAEQSCTGRGPSGSPPAYSFGSPGLLGNPGSWVAITIESAEYTAETARLALEIAGEQEEAAGPASETIQDRPDRLPAQNMFTARPEPGKPKGDARRVVRKGDDRDRRPCGANPIRLLSPACLVRRSRPWSPSHTEHSCIWCWLCRHRDHCSGLWSP